MEQRGEKSRRAGTVHVRKEREEREKQEKEESESVLVGSQEALLLMDWG